MTRDALSVSGRGHRAATPRRRGRRAAPRRAVRSEWKCIRTPDDRRHGPGDGDLPGAHQRHAPEPHAARGLGGEHGAEVIGGGEQDADQVVRSRRRCGRASAASSRSVASSTQLGRVVRRPRWPHGPHEPSSGPPRGAGAPPRRQATWTKATCSATPRRASAWTSSRGRARGARPGARSPEPDRPDPQADQPRDREPDRGEQAGGPRACAPRSSPARTAPRPPEAATTRADARPRAARPRARRPPRTCAMLLGRRRALDLGEVLLLHRHASGASGGSPRSPSFVSSSSPSLSRSSRPTGNTRGPSAGRNAAHVGTPLRVVHRGHDARPACAARST